MDKIINYVKNNKMEVLFVGFITIIAVVLRAILLVNFGEIWYDEMFSWFFASRDTFFESAYQTMVRDIHMPLYFTILHFWIKIFGDSLISMRICSIVLTLPLVPLGFYVSKYLFKSSLMGYFSAIFLAVNTFCVYYCVEIRHYSLTMVLALLTAFFFVKYIKEFDKRSKIGYIISLSLLLYTFSIAPLVAAGYLLFGLGYLSYKDRSKIWEFFKTHLIIILWCLPVVYFTIYNTIMLNQAFTYYPKDNFPHDNRMYIDIIENFFSFRNKQIILNNSIEYSNRLEMLNNPAYVICVFAPVLLAIVMTIKAFLSKKETLYLFITPTILFFIMISTLSMSAKAVIQARYFTIIFPLVILVMCYGFSLYKKKYISIILFSVFIYLNTMWLYFDKKTIYSLNRAELGNLNSLFTYTFKSRDDDLIVVPLSGQMLKHGIRKGTIIPFAADSAFVLKDKKSQEFYLGKEKAKELNRTTIRRYLLDSYIEDKPLPEYEKNLYETYIKDMKKGQRFILFSFFADGISSAKEREINLETYKNFNLPEYIISKVTRDTFLIFNKYLKLNTTYISQSFGYSVVIFEKE